MSEIFQTWTEDGNASFEFELIVVNLHAEYHFGDLGLDLISRSACRWTER